MFIKTRDHNGNDLVAYYQHNHLQAPLQAIDKQGNIRWAAQYTAFGQTSIISSGDSAINSNLRLPGQYADSESGLYYNWQRYYDANTGRYISSDPIGLAGGINTYAYVEGNPIGWVDPSGLDGYWASQHAQSQVGSGNYSYWSPHPDARGRLSELLDGRKSLKCNLFVNDMLTKGGDAPGRMPGGRVPSASEWADPKTKIPGYTVIPKVVTPQPGDVVAYDGHVGIYMPNTAGSPNTISASAMTGKVVQNDWGFRPNQSPTIRRCDCDIP